MRVASHPVRRSRYYLSPKVLLGMCAMALAGTLPCAYSQESAAPAAPPPAPAGSEPNPLAVELVKALELKENLRASALRVLEQEQDPEESEDSRFKKELTFQFYREELNWALFEEKVASVYAHRFTDEQLKDIIAFAKSPSGKAFLKATPEITADITKLTDAMMMSQLGRLERYIEDKMPLGDNSETHNRALDILYIAQQLTEMLAYYAQTYKQEPTAEVNLEQFLQLLPPEEPLRKNGGKDRLGNPYLFTKVGEPVKVHPDTRKALEPVVDATFWGRHGDGEGEGGITGMIFWEKFDAAEKKKKAAAEAAAKAQP